MRDILSFVDIGSSNVEIKVSCLSRILDEHGILEAQGWY
jgi:hypothetical protein